MAVQDIRMSILDNGAVLVSAQGETPAGPKTSTFAFKNWSEAIDWLKRETLPPSATILAFEQTNPPGLQ